MNTTASLHRTMLLSWGMAIEFGLLVGLIKSWWVLVSPTVQVVWGGSITMAGVAIVCLTVSQFRLARSNPAIAALLLRPGLIIQVLLAAISAIIAMMVSQCVGPPF